MRITANFWIIRLPGLKRETLRQAQGRLWGTRLPSHRAIDYCGCGASGDTLLFGCVLAEQATFIGGKRRGIFLIGSWRAELVLELGYI